MVDGVVEDIGKAKKQAYRRAYYLANRERTLAVNRAWAEAHPGYAKARAAKWHAENLGHHARLNAAWYQRNRDEHLKRGRENYLANREARREQIEKWRSENPERVKAAFERYARRYPDRIKGFARKWRQANPHKVRSAAMRRHAAKLRATPLWLTLEQKQEILIFYETAVLLQQILGIPHEVDHIVPLRGKSVCGLHVPWNLQILTAGANRRKSNKHA